jgi:hypothetical protein
MKRSGKDIRRKQSIIRHGRSGDAFLDHTIRSRRTTSGTDGGRSRLSVEEEKEHDGGWRVGDVAEE